MRGKGGKRGEVGGISGHMVMLGLGQRPLLALYAVPSLRRLPSLVQPIRVWPHVHTLAIQDVNILPRSSVTFMTLWRAFPALERLEWLSSHLPSEVLDILLALAAGIPLPPAGDDGDEEEEEEEEGEGKGGGEAAAVAEEKKVEKAPPPRPMVRARAPSYVMAASCSNGVREN